MYKLISKKLVPLCAFAAGLAALLLWVLLLPVLLAAAMIFTPRAWE